MPFDPKAWLAEETAYQKLDRPDVKDAAAERGFDAKAWLAENSKAEEQYPSQGFLHPLPQSGYAGIPDEDLAWYQKAEKWVQDHGGVKPGQEMFTSPALEQNKKYGVPAAGLMVAAPAAAMAAPEGAAMGLIKHAVKRGIDYMAIKKLLGH